MSSLSAAFAAFDTNGDGSITLEELRAILTRPTPHREPLSAAEVEKVFAGLDANSDGRIDIEEFTQAWATNATTLAPPDDMPSSVWEYQGTARHAKNKSLFGNYTIRRALFNPDAHPGTTSTGAITLDCEYCAASQGSVGGYRQRFDLRWNVNTGWIGWKGASWKGRLVEGPGSKLDLKNKWGNLIVLEAVKQLPDSAVMDEDNDPQEEDLEPVTAAQRAMGEAVDAVHWPVALAFLETPVLPVAVRDKMTAEEVATAQAQAGGWLVKALEAAPSREGLPALVKRLLSVYRFANQMPKEAFHPLVQLASERLDLLGKPLNELYAKQGLQG